MAPTNYLDLCAESGTKTAAEKYADAPGGVRRFVDYALRSRALPEGTPVLHQVGEGLRHAVFGDPLTMVDELRHGRSALEGLSHAARKTFVPATATGAAISYGLPLVTSAMQYSKMPAEERRYHRGELAGGTLGGMIGGQLGGRFGVPGALVIGPALQRAGMWLGRKLDPRPSEPGRYQVNPGPPGRRMPTPTVAPVQPGANPVQGRTPGL